MKYFRNKHTLKPSNSRYEEFRTFIRKGCFLRRIFFQHLDGYTNLKRCTWRGKSIYTAIRYFLFNNIERFSKVFKNSFTAIKYWDSQKKLNYCMGKGTLECLCMSKNRFGSSWINSSRRKKYYKTFQLFVKRPRKLRYEELRTFIELYCCLRHIFYTSKLHESNIVYFNRKDINN